MAARWESQDDDRPNDEPKDPLPPTHDIVWRTKNLNTDDISASVDGSMQLVKAFAVSPRISLLHYVDNEFHRLRWIHHEYQRPGILRIKSEVKIRKNSWFHFIFRDKFVLRLEFRDSAKDYLIDKYCIKTGRKVGKPIHYGWSICQSLETEDGILLITFDPSLPLHYALEEIDDEGMPKSVSVFPEAVNTCTPFILKADDVQVLVQVNDRIVKYNIDSDSPEWMNLVGHRRIMYVSGDENNYLIIFRENTFNNILVDANQNAQVSIQLFSKLTGHLVASILLTLRDSAGSPFVYFDGTLFYFTRDGYQCWDQRLCEILELDHDNEFKLVIAYTRSIIQGRFICLLGYFDGVCRSVVYIFDLQDMEVVNSIWLPETQIQNRNTYGGEELFVSENGLFHRYHRSSDYKFFSMTSMMGSDLTRPKPHLSEDVLEDSQNFFNIGKIFPNLNNGHRLRSTSDDENEPAQKKEKLDRDIMFEEESEEQQLESDILDIKESEEEDEQTDESEFEEDLPETDLSDESENEQDQPQRDQGENQVQDQGDEDSSDEDSLPDLIPDEVSDEGLSEDDVNDEEPVDMVDENLSADEGLPFDDLPENELLNEVFPVNHPPHNNVYHQDIPQQDDVHQQNMPHEDVLQEVEHPEDVPQIDVNQEDMPQMVVHQEDIPQKDSWQTDVHKEDVPQVDLRQEGPPYEENTEEGSEVKPLPTENPQFEDPTTN